MQLCKRFVSLLLVLCLALSMTVIGAAAADTEPTEELDELEKLATSYVTAYIENIYLNSNNDLSQGTISELAANTATDAALALPMEQQVLVGQEVTTLSQLCKNITFLDETAQYYGYVQTAQNLSAENFTLTITALDHVLENNYAYVHLYALIECQFPGFDDPSAAGDHYYVEFVKTGSGWTIINVTAEFLVAYGIEQESFDLQASIQAAEETFRQPVVATSPEPVEVQAVTSAYSYNKNNAIAYSMVYTTSKNNDGHDGIKDYPEFQNLVSFTSYTGNGGNCQNYVSQSLYAGLGGSNTPSKIQSGNPPMDTDGSYQWYWMYDNERTPSWSAADAFLDYAIASMDGSNSNESGLRGRWVNIPASANFSSANVTTYQLLGSVLEVYLNGDYRPGHAILIVEANNLERKNIRFNGNTPMRKDWPVGSDYPSERLALIIPTGMDVVGNHTHTYTNQGNWTGVLCNSCGYNRMRITAPMPHWGMFTSGTTWTVTGSVGFTCYRMAVGITDPSGKTTWVDYMNTGSVSRSYTFSQKGLYTIRISARNMPDSGTTAASSASTYYDYTIRTY